MRASGGLACVLALYRLVSCWVCQRQLVLCGSTSSNIPIPGRLTTSSLKTLTVVVFFFDSPHLCRRQRQKADRRPWSDLQYIETDAYQRHFFWLLRAKLLFTMGQFKEQSKLPCYCCLFELEASQRGFCSRFQQTKMTYFSTFRSAVRHADWRPFRHRYRE